jgi:hypothetical protein
MVFLGAPSVADLSTVLGNGMIAVASNEDGDTWVAQSIAPTPRAAVEFLARTIAYDYLEWLEPEWLARIVSVRMVPAAAEGCICGGFDERGECCGCVTRAPAGVAGVEYWALIP